MGLSEGIPFKTCVNLHARSPNIDQANYENKMILTYCNLKLIRNARLLIILFVRNLRRVCSQFWLSVRNSV